jgi:hypothetical protein
MLKIYQYKIRYVDNQLKIMYFIRAGSADRYRLVRFLIGRDLAGAIYYFNRRFTA